MYCKKCGTIIPDGAAFCPTCGTTQSNTGTTVGTSGEVPTKSPVGTSTPKKKRNIFQVIGMVFSILMVLTVAMVTYGNAPLDAEALFFFFLFALLALVFYIIGAKKAKEEQNRHNTMT